MVFHLNLSNHKWHEMSLSLQLGNIGSEFERAHKAKKNNKPKRFNNAFSRLLELIDLTVSDPQLQKHRLREITRMREVICDVLTSSSNKESERTIAAIKKEFLYFGILARKKCV